MPSVDRRNFLKIAGAATHIRYGCPAGRPWHQPNGPGGRDLLPFRPPVPDLGQTYLPDPPHGWADGHAAVNRGHATKSWNVRPTHGWHDLTVTFEGGAEQRFAGHLANGRDSISDPLMGGLVDGA